MKNYSHFIIVIVLFYFASALAHYEEIDLNIPKSFKVLETKSMFAVISYAKIDKNLALSEIISPTILQLNKNILPISLYGRHCNKGDSKSLLVQRVYQILPTGVRLKPIRFFAIAKGINWFEKQGLKLIHNTALRKILPRGGDPSQYYVVQDSKGQQMTLSHSLSYLGDIKGLGVEKAEEVLRVFKQNNKEYQKISLVVELYDEYFKKCSYAGIGHSKDLSHNPQRIIDEVKKMKHIHYFQNETIYNNKITVTVDELALAYLIWKSHDLRIKEILLH